MSSMGGDTVAHQVIEGGMRRLHARRIAGHSPITITQRYVHPQADAIEPAFRQTEDAASAVLPLDGEDQVGKIGNRAGKPNSQGSVSGWCERGDLNPHGFPRQILSLVRLPIPPLSRIDHLAYFVALTDLLRRFPLLPESSVAR